MIFTNFNFKFNIEFLGIKTNNLTFNNCKINKIEINHCEILNTFGLNLSNPNNIQEINIQQTQIKNKLNLNCPKIKKVNLSYNNIKELNISHITYKEIYLWKNEIEKTTLKKLKPENSKSQITIAEMNFKNAEFRNITFPINTNISDSFFKDIFYTDTTWFKENKCKNEEKKDTYIQLKIAAENNKNQVDELYFYNKEMKEIYNLTKWKNFGNKIILWFNKSTNNFGLNWWFPLLEILVLNFIFIFFLNIKEFNISSKFLYILTQQTLQILSVKSFYSSCSEIFNMCVSN